MEKFTIEIETSAGWVQYHAMMRQSRERAETALKELRAQHPESNFRLVRWMGEVA